VPNNLGETEKSVAISDHIMLHSLALAIADHAARSEIELYCLQTSDVSGRRMFDTNKPREDSVDNESLSIVDKAVRYIELRGSALPYRLKRSKEMVWFEEASSANIALAG
jgi:hypothetical protein